MEKIQKNDQNKIIVGVDAHMVAWYDKKRSPKFRREKAGIIPLYHDSFRPTIGKMKKPAK